MIINRLFKLAAKNQASRPTTGLLIIACLLSLSALAVPSADGTVSWVTSTDSNTAFQLEARLAPLAQVLDKIAKSTGVTIHYSVLPEGLVTATCVGASLKPVLECLLNHKADLIFRYPQKSLWPNAKKELEEVWVLGAKFNAIASSVTSADCQATVMKQQEQLQAMRAQQQAGTTDIDSTNALIKLAQSKDPAERSQGIGGLLAAGKPGDPEIKAILEAALSDSNPDVRAQAISSYAHRHEEGAENALMTAMQDESVDVRMMAVDSAGNNMAILQQALHDKEESIRTLAHLRLDSLNTHNGE